MAQKDNRSIQNIGGLMGNVKVITVEEIEKEEELWRTMHKMLTLSEKIVIAQMGEFKEYNLDTLLEIKQLLSVARLKAYDCWNSVNFAVKHIETGKTKVQ